jgi:translation elongation factor P (EF-P)
MATTSDLRTNMIIRYNGQLHRVVEFYHHAPGNWRAMVIMKLKNLETGKTIEERVRAGSEIEIVRVEKRPMQSSTVMATSIILWTPKHLSRSKCRKK